MLAILWASKKTNAVRRIVMLCILLLHATSCMQIYNHAPVTPQTQALKGTGTTNVTIHTEFPVRRVDEIRETMVRVPVTYSEVEYYDGRPRTVYKTKTEDRKKIELIGPVVCDGGKKHCTTTVPRGLLRLKVESNVLNSPLLSVEAGEQPLKVQVERERRAWAGGTGIFFMGLGGFLAVMGGIQTITGKPAPEDVSRSEMTTRGLTLAGVGAGMFAGGYALTWLWERGRLTVDPIGPR